MRSQIRLEYHPKNMWLNFEIRKWIHNLIRFSILSIFIIMKTKYRIEEKDEHSHRIEILNQNSNFFLLGVDPWIDWVFSLPWSSPVKESNEICARKRKNISEKRKKNEKQLRKKEKKSLILKLAKQVSKYVFVQN